MCGSTMQPIGLTRASIARPITAFLDREGASIESLLAKAGLPHWALTDPEALIPTSSAVRLLAEAAEGIDEVGVLSGYQAQIEALGTYGQLIRRSPTLGESLEQLVEHHSTFSSNVNMWIAHRETDFRLCQAFRARFDASDPGWQQASHYVLMLMIGVVRLGAGPDWRPREVQLQTDESPALRDAEALADARVSFAQPAMTITIPRALLDVPMSAPAAFDAAGQSLRAWKASAPSRDFVESIAQVVEMLSWDGYPDIYLTADVLGTSVRTLQRQLAQCGVTHGSLVDRARFATAATLLDETDTKVLDIALDLGYSDHSHFTRAFRRWAGCSPREYRHRRIGRRTQQPGVYH